MKILSWNIRHGGGSRVIRIQSVIADHKPDILILSEFRNNAAGVNLRHWLSDFGHKFQAAGNAQAASDNAVLVSSLFPFKEVSFPELKINSHRCVGARFEQLTLLGLYFPVMEAKRPVRLSKSIAA
jgi:exodeoxyribonuclease III